MKAIKTLNEMVEHVKGLGLKKRIAVVSAEDPNTVGAIAKAVNEGFAEAIMMGKADKIKAVCEAEGLNPNQFTIIDIQDEVQCASEAVRMVRDGEADVLMKGLIGTDKFLKAVLNKKEGLLPPKAVMSYVCAVEVPKYDKLLFLTDTAVIPFPDLNQKIAMLKYSVSMAKKFGIEMPKVALLSAAEKASQHFPSHTDYSVMCQMVNRKQLPACTIDGPIDMFLACDPESVKIKGVPTPVNGEADVLIFPSIEASNIFYKGVMLFGGGELAGLIQGTIKPVVVMSRSESPASKFYCIALSCLMAEDE